MALYDSLEEKKRFEKSRQALRIGALGGLIFSASSHSATAGQVGGCYYGVYIDEPDMALYTLGSSDPLSVSIDYQAIPNGPPNVAGCEISWSLQYSYTTSGGVGPFTSTDSFMGKTRSAVARATGSRGGTVLVTAESVMYPAPVTTTIYIAGDQISNSDITSELTALYAANNSGLSGYTPDLLCHIAVQESGYAQFKSSNLYGQPADWPTENGAAGNVKAGTYIGLLQVPVSMSTAFNWKQNGKSGDNILNTKLQNVLSYQSSQQSGNADLPSMTAEQVEDSALVFYGGFSNRNTSCQKISGLLRLYVPVSNVWTLSPAANCVSTQGNTAEQYVTGIRSNVLPQ